MKRKEITERMANGLRKLNCNPDCFLFDDGIGLDWTWDESVIFCIPVYHTPYPIRFTPEIDEVPFLPCWKNDDHRLSDACKFAEGWCDYDLQK